MISLGADVNYFPPHTVRPLLMAVKKGNVELTRALLEEGADIRGVTGQTALSIARESGRTEMKALLVKWGAVERSREDDVVAHVTKVAEMGRKIVADVHGAPPVSLDFVHEGVTLLQAACMEGDTDTARKLIGFGANPNDFPTLKTAPPIVIAASFCNLQLVRMLIEEGVDISGDAGARALKANFRRGSGAQCTDVAALLRQWGARDVEAEEDPDDSPGDL